jgi:hypothetical protein
MLHEEAKLPYEAAEYKHPDEASKAQTKTVEQFLGDINQYWGKLAAWEEEINRDW